MTERTAEMKCVCGDRYDEHRKIESNGRWFRWECRGKGCECSEFLRDAGGDGPEGLKRMFPIGRAF